MIEPLPVLIGDCPAPVGLEAVAPGRGSGVPGCRGAGVRGWQSEVGQHRAARRRSRPGSTFTEEAWRSVISGARAAEDRRGQPACFRTRAGQACDEGECMHMKVRQLSVFIENKAGRVSEVTELLGELRRQHPGVLGLRHRRLRDPAPGRGQARRGARRSCKRAGFTVRRTRSSASTSRTSPAGSPGCSRSSRRPA